MDLVPPPPLLLQPLLSKFFFCICYHVLTADFLSFFIV